MWDWNFRFKHFVDILNWGNFLSCNCETKFFWLLVAYLVSPIPCFADQIITSSGTGFFFTDTCHVATNFHVIANADALVAVDYLNQRLPLKIVAIDKANDLAILKTNPHDCSPMSLEQSNSVRKGEQVFTLGFPRPNIQGRESKFTSGIVSSLSGIKGDLSAFQISAPVQPGNSGGPLINERGNVVGVIVAKLSLQKGEGVVPDGVNYAVKSSYLFEMLSRDSNARTSTRISGASGKILRPVDIAEKSEISVLMILALAEQRMPSFIPPDVTPFPRPLPAPSNQQPGTYVPPNDAADLLAKSKNCLACHSVDRRIVGPAFKDVAKKYAGQNDAEAKLTEKILKGGKGSWGVIPMPPNASVTPAESTKLVKWILGMK